MCGRETRPAAFLRATMAATSKPPELRESPRLLRGRPPQPKRGPQTAKLEVDMIATSTLPVCYPGAAAKAAKAGKKIRHQCRRLDIRCGRKDASWQRSDPL